MPSSPKPAPTKEQFAAYERMFRHFNRALFGDGLPNVLLNFSRRAHTNGFFAPQRWQRGRAVHHEISLNPSTLKLRRPIDVASTLAHEMVHLWQEEFGKPSRRGYHNRQWAARMEAIGLMPSSTAAPGGRRVGQHVSHYILRGGSFERAFRELPKEDLLPWTCGEQDDGKTTNRNKVKYTCDACETNVWGKPSLNIVCGNCDQPFVEVVS